MDTRKKIAVIATVVLFLLPSITFAQVIFPNRGGTGTSTIPSVGQLLVGQSDGTYAPRATSTLGLEGSGTVTSVDMTVPTGLTVSGVPITSAGTISLLLQSGYVIPLTASTTQWATAYGWGDHSAEGYLTDITTESILDLLDVSGSHASGSVLISDGSQFNVLATSSLGISGGGGGDGLATSSIDTEAELQDILTDVTDIFTNNDGALSDDDLSDNSTSDLSEGTNLYYTEARVQNELTNGNDAVFGGSTSTDLAVTGTFNFLGDVITNVSTWFSTLFDTNFASKDTDDLTEGSNLYYTDARVSSYVAASSSVPSLDGTASGDVFVWDGSAWQPQATSTLGISGGSGDGLATSSIDTEAELESILTDVTDVFTNNDGALSDDDLSDDDLDALSNVAAMTEENGDILYYNSGAWQRLPSGNDGQVLKLSSGLPDWGTDSTGGAGGLGTTTPWTTGDIVEVADSGTVKSTSTVSASKLDSEVILASEIDTAAEFDAVVTDGALSDDDLSDNDTDDLSEGASNFYYTESRFSSSLAATTSVDSITTLDNLSITESQISDLDHFTGADITGSETAFDGWDKDASDDYSSADFSSDLAATSSVDSITILSNLSITESQISDLAHYLDSDVSSYLYASTTISDLCASITGGGGLCDGNDADTQLTQEQVEDFAGGMVSGNTETLIDVTYQDGDGTFDLVVDGNLSNYTNDAGFLTSVDISDDTNLTVSGPITLTGDQLGFNFGLANTWTATNTFATSTFNRVGIGTSTPETALDVWSSAGSKIAQFFSDGVDMLARFIELDSTPAADHSSSGNMVKNINAATTIAAGDALNLDSSGTWGLADASATTTSASMIGIAIGSGTNGNPVDVALNGSFVRDDSWNWTVGEPVYISTTAGDLTQTDPGSPNVLRRVGFARNADVIYMDVGAVVE